MGVKVSYEEWVKKYFHEPESIVVYYRRDGRGFYNEGELKYKYKLAFGGERVIKGLPCDEKSNLGNGG